MSVSLKESFDIAYDGSENAARMDLFIDDVSDLSSLTHFDSIKILQGSTAKDISTGDLYQMQTGGTWVLQPGGIQLDLTGYYTSAETDTLLSGKQPNLTQTQLDAIDNAATALPEIINAGAKNKLSLTIAEMQTKNTAGTWSGNAYTVNGITFTVNSDMTITANGTLSGDRALFRLFTYRQNTYGGLWLSGCPSGGGSIVIEQTSSPYANIAADSGSGSAISSRTDSQIYAYIAIATDVSNLTYSPMISTRTDWDISHDYVQYCPSLYELYQLVLSYHP